MLLPIYMYDAPVLKQKTKRITEIDDELLAFIMNMHETMHRANGIGLAANQVGQGIALTVIDVSKTEGNEDVKPVVMINPEVLESDGEAVFEEGCLSLPELREEVTRASDILVRFMDPNMKEVTMEAGGLLARVMLHEIDHLNGIYFFERLPRIKQTLVKPQLNRIRKGEIETSYPIVVTPQEPRRTRSTVKR
ncbi:MAG TPA: peptide deformylase [Candidatus Kapabacteria bacterium]|nr:peptide deformylase [Candidatus Kapabacteria bacterium]